MILWYPTTKKPFHQFHLHCCLLLELDYFHNLPTQQYSSFGLHFNTMWNTIKLAFLLDLWYILLCNIHVYAIYLISCSTLSKLVRPLIVLSFNSPKPTKGLDALSPCSCDDDESIKVFFVWKKWKLCHVQEGRRGPCSSRRSRPRTRSHSCSILESQLWRLGALISLMLALRWHPLWLRRCLLLMVHLCLSPCRLLHSFSFPFVPLLL